MQSPPRPSFAHWEAHTDRVTSLKFIDDPPSVISTSVDNMVGGGRGRGVAFESAGRELSASWGLGLSEKGFIQVSISASYLSLEGPEEEGTYLISPSGVSGLAGCKGVVSSMLECHESHRVSGAGCTRQVHIWSAVGGTKLGTLDLQEPTGNLHLWRFEVVEEEDAQKLLALKEVGGGIGGWGGWGRPKGFMGGGYARAQNPCAVKGS
jgi:hypothetical protein